MRIVISFAMKLICPNIETNKSAIVRNKMDIFFKESRLGFRMMTMSIAVLRVMATGQIMRFNRMMINVALSCSEEDWYCTLEKDIGKSLEQT